MFEDATERKNVDEKSGGGIDWQTSTSGSSRRLKERVFSTWLSQRRTKLASIKERALSTSSTTLKTTSSDDGGGMMTVRKKGQAEYFCQKFLDFLFIG